VNDGSCDQTAAILKSFRKNERIKIIQFAHNQGKSNAMVTAALRAQGDLLVFLDADLLHLSAEHIDTLIQPLLEHKAEMVIGDPFYKSAFVKMIDPFRALSGERALWRSDFLPLIEQVRHSGYGIESLLNLAYQKDHKKVIFRKLDGLIHPIKAEKTSAREATTQYLEEGSQIASAFLNRAYQK
jgi:molybdopterin-guanine dinucleotide biosynthesis protein A